jgi:site-specific DNA-adenine methylase
MKQKTFDFSSLDSDEQIEQSHPKSAVKRSFSQVSVNRIRPPVKAHGGKYYLARQIVPILLTAPDRPADFLEPCAFGASVFLAMPKHEQETLGDMNPEVVNLWRVLSRHDYASVLVQELSRIQYDQDTFDRAGNSSPVNEVEQAVQFIIRSRFSRGGLCKSFAWSNRERGGLPGDENSWNTFRKSALPKIIERAAGINVVDDECWWVVWQSRNKTRRLIYADPPYMPDTRSAKKAYGEFEMSRLHHFWLVAALRAHTGPAAISGYRNDDYDRWLSDWQRFDFDMPNNSGQTKQKQRRIESFWINWGAAL